MHKLFIEEKKLFHHDTFKKNKLKNFFKSLMNVEAAAVLECSQFQQFSWLKHHLEIIWIYQFSSSYFKIYGIHAEFCSSHRCTLKLLWAKDVNKIDKIAQKIFKYIKKYFKQ